LKFLFIIHCGATLEPGSVTSIRAPLKQRLAKNIVGWGKAGVRVGEGRCQQVWLPASIFSRGGNRDDVWEKCPVLIDQGEALV